MIYQNISDVVTPELMRGAIENNRHPGFIDDYAVLICLIKIHKPRRIFEFGTNTGFGTKIMCNAAGAECEVVSFDLPTSECDVSLQHPINEGKGDIVGKECTFPFIQLRGNSYTYDFSSVGKFDFAWVDSEHNYEVPLIEAKAAIAAGAKVIAFHDSDIPEVYRAIVDAFENQPYTLYRVTDTRIAYAVLNA